MTWILVAVAVLVLAGGLFIWSQSASAERMLEAGSQAPSFSLPNQDGSVVDSATLAGGWWVIYFYPKDDTPGCTKEACAFRDQLDELQAMEVRILGVSFDDVASHKAFAEKYHLTFDLLADPDGKVIDAYGARSVMPGFASRVSYLVDGEGIIRKVYPAVSPSEHAAEIINDVRALRD
ncbi:MAG: peroxiredoxin [Mariprofundaceae bacterium]